MFTRHKSWCLIRASTCRNEPRIHFTKGLCSSHNQIMWKCVFLLDRMCWSNQSDFAYAATAELPCHMQNCELIESLLSKLKQKVLPKILASLLLVVKWAPTQTILQVFSNSIPGIAIFSRVYSDLQTATPFTHALLHHDANHHETLQSIISTNLQYIYHRKWRPSYCHK